jgi:hypothetical protein
MEGISFSVVLPTDALHYELHRVMRCFKLWYEWSIQPEASKDRLCAPAVLFNRPMPVTAALAASLAVSALSHPMRNAGSEGNVYRPPWTDLRELQSGGRCSISSKSRRGSLDEGVPLTNPPDGAIPHDPLPLIIRTRTQEPPISLVLQIPPLSSPRFHSLPFSRPPANPKLPGKESSLAIQLRSHGKRFDRRHPDGNELHVRQEHRCCKQCEEAGPEGYKTETLSFVAMIFPVNLESKYLQCSDTDHLPVR